LRKRVAKWDVRRQRLGAAAAASSLQARAYTVLAVAVVQRVHVQALLRQPRSLQHDLLRSRGARNNA
jgi:hypothetical protein